jgi:hypothetical protein
LNGAPYRANMMETFRAGHPPPYRANMMETFRAGHPPAVGTANVATGIVARATDIDNTTKAASGREIVKDAMTGFVGGAAGNAVGQVARPVVLESNLVQSAGSALADGSATSITAGAKGAYQLGFDALMTGVDVAAEASSGIVSTTAQTTLSSIFDAYTPPTVALATPAEQPK